MSAMSTMWRSATAWAALIALLGVLEPWEGLVD
jgi:hypothetical protein